VVATPSLRDGDDVLLLDQPPERDLDGGLPVSLADLGQQVVVRDGASGQRTVRGQRDVARAAEGREIGLVLEGGW
jgi:hypothetical protein